MKKYWYKVRHFMDRYGLGWHDIKAGTKNLIIWFPTIWLDRWWDHSFLYRILRFKLSLMEKGFRTRGISVNSERDAKNIKKCILLLDRLIKDDYIVRIRKCNIRKSFEEEQRMIEQDLELLFKILRKHIRTWWD